MTAPQPRNQAQYQIRFDWGLEGARAVSVGCDILVWVDALPERPGEALDPSGLEFAGAVVAGTVGNRDAVAHWVLDQQVRRGDRATVAVVAAGSVDGRFAVEDLLAAGAIIDALAEVGIDYISPEAAAAVGAFVGLRNATSHVLSACVSGQEHIRAGNRSTVDAARERNSLDTVRVLREFPASA